MSSSIGGINKFGLDYTPISSYNKLLENSLENVNSAINTGESVSEFDGILNNQMANMQNQISMSNPINTGITMNVNNIPDLQGASVIEGSDGSITSNMTNDIGKAFAKSINSLNEKQIQAESAVETLASGGDISVHDVMIASEKANLSMQMALQLRNKILSAYNELYQLRF